MSGSVDGPTLLRGRNVVLRPLQVDDVERVAEIQAEPGVARWWGLPDEAQLRRQADGVDDEKAFAIETDGELVGLFSTTRRTSPTSATQELMSSLPSAPTGAAWGPTRCGRSRAI